MWEYHAARALWPPHNMVEAKISLEPALHEHKAQLPAGLPCVPHHSNNWIKYSISIFAIIAWSLPAVEMKWFTYCDEWFPVPFLENEPNILWFQLLNCEKFYFSLSYVIDTWTPRRFAPLNSVYFKQSKGSTSPQEWPHCSGPVKKYSDPVQQTNWNEASPSNFFSHLVFSH